MSLFLGIEGQSLPKAEIVSQYGEPSAATTNSAMKKEIHVYMVNRDDSTGVYIYYKDGKVAKTERDEFTGSFDSSTWFNEP